MAKLQLKGIIYAVEKPLFVGEKNTEKQLFYLKVPAYVDEFGDVRGRDELWQITVMGDNVRKFNLTTEVFEGKKAIVNLYVNSNYIEPKKGPEGVIERSEMYIVNLNLASIEIK